MKFVHLSDLHIGKRVHEFKMAEDQQYILAEILSIIDDEKPDAVLIAGDVYDKSIPGADAVEILDDFLTKLHERGQCFFLISGNHDCPERIAFASSMMSENVHISPAYKGEVEPTVLTDSFGEVNVYMLPFVKPANVRGYFPNEEIESYTQAVGVAVNQMKIDSTKRNVLVTHQFVTGASRSESEEISVGGTDNVDACVFSDFDYVALGHIHSPQNAGGKNIRYCGTPLKYSFSEAKDQKSVTVVELKEKGDLTVRTVPLTPLHEMVELRGKYDELMAKSFYENTSYKTDYVHITLTDEQDVYQAFGKLRAVYKNLMKLNYDNQRTRTDSVISGVREVEKKSPFALFCELFELQNNQHMTENQEEYLKKMIEQIWEEEECDR